MKSLKLFFALFLFINLALVNSVEAADFRTKIGSGFNTAIYSTALQPDGKIIVGGGFTTFASTTHKYLVRLNADGTEDAAFGTNLENGLNAVAYSTALQSDGKIIVGGNFTTFGSSTRNRLVRLNADGTEDITFDTNLGSGFNGIVYDMAIQADGKIIVGGNFTTFNGTTHNALIRLNADGTEDITFDTNLGSGFNGIVYDMAIQADGKIIVGGNFTTFGSSTRNRLVRLNADGTEDITFDTNLGSGLNAAVYSTAIQSNGKILVGGNFTTFNGSVYNCLIRLNTDGTVDVTFTTNLGISFNQNVLYIYIQSDGKILTGGNFITFNGSARNRLVRLNVDGTEDLSFYNNLGSAFNNFINTFAVQSDGKILTGGNFITFNGSARNRLVRLNADGTEDSDLVPPVITINGAASSTITMGSVYTDAGATAVDAIDGNVNVTITVSNTVNTNYGGAQTVVYRAFDGSGNVTYATRTVNVLLPASPDGFYKRLGAGFSLGGVTATKRDTSGNIFVAGGFSSFKGNVRNYIVKLNASGTEQSSFYTNTGSGFDSSLGDIAIQSDGKVIIGGFFTSFNGNIRNRLVRLNNDGTEDTAFYTNLGSGVNNSYVNKVTVQTDGKILVGGRFTSFASSTRNGIFRLNANGTEDTAFYTNIGTGLTPSGNAKTNAIRLQSDGKILLGGDFTALNGSNRNHLVRLNNDGTEDTTFASNTPSGIDSYVYDVAVDSNGGVIVGGAFTGFGGTGHKYLLRLNASGTEDMAFYTNLGSGFNLEIYSIKVQSDGKILVGGDFTTFKGSTRNHMVRLNADGTEDATFTTNIGTGFNQYISDIFVQADGKILVGGNFTSLNGNTRNELVRLNPDGTEDLDLVAPVITILGSNPASITVGSAYVDAGATALDAIEGDVTASTTATSSVNTNIVGAYTVVYTARDTSSNLSYATRTVSVIAAVSGGGGGGGGSSSGGGGGGGYYIPPVVAQTSTTTKATTTSTSTKANTTSNNLIAKSTTTLIIERLTKVLSPRSVDAEVKILQKFLNANGYVIAKTGLGSKGKESLYMGQATVNALKKFQRDNGIYPSNGYTGIATRNKINSKLLTQIITTNDNSKSYLDKSLEKQNKGKDTQYTISKIWDYTFLAPRALAIDAFDNVYVSETYKGPGTHSRILKFDKDGTMLGWFGKGNMTSGYHEASSREENTGNGNAGGEFTYIFKITFDDQNNMYVIDRNKYDDGGVWHYSGGERVQRFDSKGVYTGSLVTGVGAWVGDVANGVFGTAYSGAKIKAAEGDELSCIAIKGDALLLGSWKKNRIVKINKNTGQSLAWFGKSNKDGYGWHTNMSDESVSAPHFGDEVGAFNGVIDCNIYDNDMYVVSYNSNPVVGVYDYISGKYLRGLSHNDGYKPQELIVDKDKNLIISDNYEGSIRFLNKDFVQQNKIQLGPGGDYFGVGDFALNSKGMLYFTEQKKEKVYELKK